MATGSRWCDRRSLAVAAFISMAQLAPVGGTLPLAWAQARSGGVGCEEWQILGSSKGATAKAPERVQVCSQLLRDVPKLAAAVDRLNKASAESDRNRQRLSSFTQSLSD